MINGVSTASESSARIRSPMEFPWLLYWISFKFVTLSGAMLIAVRYESSRLRRVHLSFRGEESPSRASARGSGLQLHTVLCIRNDSYVRKVPSLSLSLAPLIQSPFWLLFRKWIYYLARAPRLSRANAHPQNSDVPFLFPPWVSGTGQVAAVVFSLVSY